MSFFFKVMPSAFCRKLTFWVLYLEISYKDLGHFFSIRAPTFCRKLAFWALYLEISSKDLGHFCGN